MRNLSFSKYEQIRARAAAGAALLDRVVPGWWRKVRIRKLDVSSPCDCVTGQLFGSFEKGLDKLNLGHDEACDYGFEKIGDYDYWTLTHQWRDELRRRRYGERVGRQ